MQPPGAEPTSLFGDDPWQLGKFTFRSRLLIGTARYPSRQVLLDAVTASGSEIATVAVRRVALQGQPDDLYSVLRQRGMTLLANTAGCMTAQQAVLTAQLARAALDTPLIKLEVIFDEDTLLPDPQELLTAARILVRDGFVVLPYTNDDPVTAQRLEDIGCAAIMPLAAPIGSGLGIRNPHNMALIKERASVPVIIDAGLGSAADVAQAFELGCDAVLLNTAIARADEPVQMAQAMGLAAQAGRLAFRAGRIPKKHHASPSSPMTGRVGVGA